MSNVVLQLRRRYKNGGASYSREGIRASVYVGPKMFAAGPTETFTVDDNGLATPEDTSAKDQAKLEAKAARAKVVADRQAAREAAKVQRQQEREAARVAREQAKEAARQARITPPAAATPAAAQASA